MSKPEIPDKKTISINNNTNSKFVRANITHKEDIIRIPLPSYSYGASRRARFVFDRITPAQAKANIMIQRRTHEDTAEEPWPELQQFEDSEEEQHFFLTQDIPDINDCA